jgi:hypothetical protein
MQSNGNIVMSIKKKLSLNVIWHGTLPLGVTTFRIRKSPDGLIYERRTNDSYGFWVAVKDIKTQKYLEKMAVQEKLGI